MAAAVALATELFLVGALAMRHGTPTSHKQRSNRTTVSIPAPSLILAGGASVKSVLLGQ
jgi:hypothetical protein